MPENQKRGGKKEEPKEEELVFIYECLARGLADSEVLEEMKSEEFLLRQQPFIARRRKEFNAAKKVLARQGEGAFDSDIAQSRKDHRQRLSERAQEIMDYLKSYFPFIDDLPVVAYLVDQDDFETSSMLTDYRSACLLEHLKHEFPALAELESWEELVIDRIKEWDLINILGSKADKGVFTGKCETCKDWD